ncbi:hypothetical protein EDI_070690 [Entamoeba dispar SAW760]|uniref:Uncharacterized protein n=1 Tax=Entamoeba dispar (strain ATCC PRA-260 / SAW760) TaxID=370354 RepID=B0EMA9_ENTDS|nr:uncharacterized protein EDI_070690 [Entamoeba dispar SAW760]EDR24327.1 hypothetical protein EDI_070690 [Entamoeba dispar SAW760]|eukprot:EDR24327.1 hypothetical protein EDI_070690 [Entamoeba dispar SAW760]
MRTFFFLLFALYCFAAKPKTEMKTEEFVLGEWTFEYYMGDYENPSDILTYNITTIDGVISISPIIDGVQEDPIGRVEAEGNSMTVFINENVLFSADFEATSALGVYQSTVEFDNDTYEIIIPHPKFPKFIVSTYGKSGKRLIIGKRTVIIPPKTFFQKYGMFIMIGVLILTFFFKGNSGPEPQQAAAPVAERPKTE